MNPRALLRRVATGAVHNVGWADFIGLVEALGFRRLRVQGSHHVYGRDDIPELINLQRLGSGAKPYQIRQLLKLVERYGLQLGGEE